MRVIVYVEGPSDKLSMEALLAPIILKKKQKGILINFFSSPPGDKKKTIITKVPIKAANIIFNDPEAIVVAMPDLYPKNAGLKHETFEELKSGILSNFEETFQRKAVQVDSRLKKRFQVFCFKHDLEALILAATDSLKKRLETNSIAVNWKIPVEDQNHDNPPKKIVENIFRNHGKKYQNTVDAPIILNSCKYQEIADQCPQCFKPFVEFLENL